MAYRSRYAAPAPAVRRRTSRWRIFLPSLVLLALFAGLASFWAYSAWRVGRELDLVLAREAAQGRTWTCPDRAIEGFPFRIEVTCARPAFSGAVNGRAWRGEVAGLRAVAQIQSPHHVIVEVDGPLAVTDSAGGRLDMDWDLLHASLQGDPARIGRLDQLAVEITKPRLVLAGYGALDMTASGDLVDVHVRRTPGRPEADQAYDVASRGTRLSVPLADRLMGGAAPVDTDVVATVVQGESLATGAPPSNLEAWRLAGGKLQVSRLMLARGPQRVDATGILALDELHRPQGRLDLSVAGVDDLLQQFGLSPKAANIGGLIAGVLGGRMPRQGQAEAAEKPPGGVVLPLRLEDGKAFLGPLPVARLLPLY